MVLTCLALLLFLKNSFRRCALVVQVVLVLVKETGIAAPNGVPAFGCCSNGVGRSALLFTAPLLPLGIWLMALHHVRRETGRATNPSLPTMPFTA